MSHHRQNGEDQRTKEDQGTNAPRAHRIQMNHLMPIEGAIGCAQLRTPSLSRCLGREATN